MPVSFSQAEAAKLALGFVSVHDSSVENHVESCDYRPVCELQPVHRLFVKIIAHIIGTVHHKENLKSVIELFIDDIVRLINPWFQSQHQLKHKVAILRVIVVVEGLRDELVPVSFKIFCFLLFFLRRPNFFNIRCLTF